MILFFFRTDEKKGVEGHEAGANFDISPTANSVPEFRISEYFLLSDPFFLLEPPKKAKKRLPEQKLIRKE